MKDYREDLLSLQNTGYFTPESLLEEVIISMSTDEAKETLEHICRHYDIDIDQVNQY